MFLKENRQWLQGKGYMSVLGARATVPLVESPEMRHVPRTTSTMNSGLAPNRDTCHQGEVMADGKDTTSRVFARPECPRVSVDDCNLRAESLTLSLIVTFRIASRRHLTKST